MVNVERSLLNYVPYVPMHLTCLRAFVPQITTCLGASNYYAPTCLRVLHYYVPTCLRGLNYYVPTCLHFSRVYVLTCLYIFFRPTYLRAINYFVPTCAHFSRAYVKISHKIYSGSLLYFVLLFFSGLLFWPFIPLKNPKKTPVNCIPQSYLVGFCYFNWCMHRKNNLRTHSEVT